MANNPTMNALAKIFNKAITKLLKKMVHFDKRDYD